MSKKVTPLECTIQPCGLPFQVTDTLKDTTFGPGTQGLLSFIMGPDYNNPNIVFQKVITTRRGKNGKSRMNLNMILSPLFKVPGVDFNAMFPKAGDRKHFIDIVVDKEVTGNVMPLNDDLDPNYLAWMFARCLFVRELDKAVYPPEHQIMSSLNMGGTKRVYVWPKEKLNKLKRFVESIERWYNEGAQDSIMETFGGEQNKHEMLADLRAIEAALLIPRMEYQRKVNSVLVDALNYVSKFVNDKANKVKDLAAVNESISESRRIITAQKASLDGVIKTRLKTIANNRQLLNF